MNGKPDCAAWMETPDGQQISVGPSCLIGRARLCQVVLADPRVSRRHALVQRQAGDEYWVVDFGTPNGTRVNGRRVTQPMPLKDDDEIEIASVCLRFRQSLGDREGLGDLTRTTTVTVREVHNVRCWLLVADILDSTRLFQATPAEELPVLVGQWFLACRETIEAFGGTIHQYLGDGFFALWPDGADVPGRMRGALDQLQGLQRTLRPAFRVVLHYGMAASGGAVPGGAGSIMGSQVHFVFRMEKLAGALNRGLLLSREATERLGIQSLAQRVGAYELKGFEGQFEFYTL